MAREREDDISWLTVQAIQGDLVAVFQMRETVISRQTFSCPPSI